MASFSKSSIGGRTRFARLLVVCGVSAVGIPCLSGCGVASSGLNANGNRYFQQGNPVAAIKRFEKAIALNPRDADGYYNLGATYHQLSKTGTDVSYASQSENYYNQCLDVNPDHTECYRGLAVLLFEQGRRDQAFRLLEGWKSRSPNLADPLIELARLHEEDGNRKASEEHLLGAIARDTTNPRARVALGKIREEEGDLQQALNDYNIALSRNRVQPQLQARVATLNSSLNPGSLITPNPTTRIVAAPAARTRY